MAAKKSTTTKAKSTAKSQAKPKTTRKKSPAKPRSTQKFVRNLTGTAIGIRIERQEGKQRFNLKPRGHRGDLAPLQKDDINDAVLQQNVGLGVIEIITKAEADEVIHKQTTNQQAAHPALSTLRNELGEEYGADAVVVSKEFNEQGQVVAHLSNGEVVIAKDGSGIQRRKPGEAPGTPSYVQGADGNHQPADESPEFLSDRRAREKREVQAHDILPNVSVDPVQKT
jgi:hypothetical protein